MPAHDQQTELANFLALHVKPYDATTDDYERPPFAADIKEDKNDAIYNAHSYHTKVPPRSIIPYILHYTRPGDLVLDPFCGSGMTGVAVQMCTNPPPDLLEQYPELKERAGPRACVLSDLSPAACHIAYNYNTPVDVEALRREFERIKAAVTDEFEWLYGTEHYEPAVGLYDPANSDVASRLKDSPRGGARNSLLDGEERIWQLLTRPDVEARLGYPVTELPRNDDWGNLDLASVERWVCIPAAIQYTVWSDVYRCEGFVTLEEPTGKISNRGKNAGRQITRKKKIQRGCGQEFALWDVAVDLNKGEISNSLSCPNCNQQWEKRQLQKLREDPKLVTYEYSGLALKRKGSRKRKTRKDRRPTGKEITHIETIQSQTIPNWYPSHLIDMGREMMRHGMAKQSLATIGEFWTTRNKRALAKLWSEIQNCAVPRVRSALTFAFTAILFRVSRRRIVYCPKGGGWASTVISGTLYIPSLNAEANVWGSFANKADDILALTSNIPAVANVLVQQGDAAQLASLPVDSVDYIFADPPFGQNIYYADCSLLWEGWLDDFTDESKEIVVNERRQGEIFKELEDYELLMVQAFSEMFRVLKPNRFATIEFNNSDGAVFEAIKRAVKCAGFHIENMLLLDKSGKTYKQMKAIVDGEDVVDKDVLFNLHKPVGVRTEVRSEDYDVERQVADAVRNHLQTLPERIKADAARYNDEHRTTATINSMLMNTLIPKGVGVERLNLPFIERVCARYFRKIGQRWYLRGEAAGGNGGDGLLIAEEATINDELTAIAWLRQRVQPRPILIGELKPLWMRATGLLPAEVSQSLILENLLTENFWRDLDTNRWREPTPEERERMNDDRSLRVLHDAERFVNGALRRETTDEERCEWIDVLFQACRAIEDNEMDALPALRGFDKTEAYALIPRLFQSILRDHVPSDAYTRADKQARAASQRVQKQVQEEQVTKATSRAKADVGQGKLDFKKTT